MGGGGYREKTNSNSGGEADERGNNQQNQVENHRRYNLGLTLLVLKL